MMNDMSRSRSKLSMALVLVAFGSVGAVLIYQRFTSASRQPVANLQGIVEALQKKGRDRDAESVKVTCSSREHSICDCAEFAAPLALNQDLGTPALDLLKPALVNCPESAAQPASHPFCRIQRRCDTFLPARIY